MVSRETAFTRRCPLPGAASSSDGFQGTALSYGSLFALAQSALDPVLSDG